MWSSIGPGSCSPGNKFMLLDRIALIWVPSSPLLYWLEASLHFALEKGGVGMSVYLEFPNVSSHSLVELLWFFCWQKRTVWTVTSDVWGCIQVNLGCWGIHCLHSQTVLFRSLQGSGDTVCHGKSNACSYQKTAQERAHFMLCGADSKPVQYYYSLITCIV